MTDLPEGLNDRGARFWHATIDAYQLTDTEVGLLAEAWRTLDDLDRLADAIRTEGAMVPGSAGQPVVNPALTEARGQRLALHRLLSALQLPADDGVPLPTPVTVRNRQAAKARWPGKAV